MRCVNRPAQEATPDDWQQLASRAAVSTFAISGLAAKPAGVYFVSVTADHVPLMEGARTQQSVSQASRNPTRRRSPLGTSVQPAAGQAALSYIAFRRDAAAGAVGRSSSSHGKLTTIPPVPILVRRACLTQRHADGFCTQPVA
jgi:hypothetical protein